MILMYHNIRRGAQQIDFAEWQPAYDVSFEAFLRHLDTIRRTGAESGRQALSTGVQLTFDDGYHSLCEVLPPLVEESRWPCICFVATSAIGKRGMLSLQDLVDLCRAGIELGTHSHSHVFLEGLSRKQLASELQSPKHFLEDIVGMKIESFSLPGGRFDHRTLEFAAEFGYRRVYTSWPGQRKWRLRSLPELELFPRWLIAAETSINELQTILRGDHWHALKKRSLYLAGRLGKHLLGNHLYHSIWQKAHHLKTSTLERGTS